MSRAVICCAKWYVYCLPSQEYFLFRTYFLRKPRILRFTSVCDVTYQFVMQTLPNLHKSDWSSYAYGKLCMCVTNK